MKKTIMLLGAVLALAACAKTVTVVDEPSNAIAINAVMNAQTKGAEVVGTTYPADWSIYVGASTTEQPQFLNDAAFAKDGDVWKGGAYWPIGGKTVDFLAYGLAAADKTALAPAFDATTAASKFTVTAWNTLTKQADLLYAVANGKKSSAAPVPMQFNHALALIVFNVRHNTGGGDFAIKNITFGVKNTTGTLEVNNERNTVALNWSALSTAELVFPAATVATAATQVVGTNGAAAGCVKYEDVVAVGTTFKQLGETLLVIPQAASNPVITYTLDGKDYVYEANALRLNWEAGKAYIYDLSFNTNEITIAPTVVDWVVVDPS